MSKVDQTPTTPFTPDPLTLALLGQGNPRSVRAARIARALPPERAAAWIRAGERMAGGMAVAEAEAMMRRELGGTGAADLRA